MSKVSLIFLLLKVIENKHKLFYTIYNNRKEDNNETRKI